MIGFRRLLRWLHPDVEIKFGRDEVAFSACGRTERLAPVLYLKPDAKRPLVTAVGSRCGASGDLEVRLFDPGPLPPTPWTREDAVSAFVRYGISSVLRRRVFVWPVVHLQLVASIPRLFLGQEKDMLARACRNAGAWEVTMRSFTAAEEAAPST